MPVASPIAWTTIHDALHDWLSGALGIATIWAEQDAEQPPYPFAVLNIVAGPTKVAGQDEQRITFDGGQPAGEEVGIEVAGLREITVSCQVLAAASSTTAPQDQSRVARDLLSRAQSSLVLPTVIEALRVAGLAVIEEGAVQNVSEVVEDSWIGRASMDVRFWVAASIEERTGYIKDVEVEHTYDKPDGTEVDADLRQTFIVEGP
jgi:hypothetical protein